MYDFHTHFIPEDIMLWLKDNRHAINAKWVKKENAKEDFLIVNEKWGFELKEVFYQLDLYLSEQGKAGVNHSMISPVPQLFMYDFPIEISLEVSALYNLSLSNLVNNHPNQLSGLATVPLTHPERAAQILNKAMQTGLKGAIIGPGLPGHMLSDPFFTPFFEEADRLKAIIFIHPLLSEDPRLKKRMMPNLVGIPWETTVCATDLLLSGMLDKYENMKVLLAHGGGFLPYQIGRLDKGYEKWTAVSTHLQAPPSQYLKRFWYDNVLWNQESLEYLIKTVGENRVVPGSDYPFDLCAWPPKETHYLGAKSLLE